ncbi:MAG: glycosyltransferase family 4 protein [Chloroflexota bacterium]
MRILMLTDFYPPIVGGVEQHVRNLSIALTERGHRVTVATLAHEGLAPFEIDEHGVRIYRVKGTMQRIEVLFSNPGRRYAPPIPDPEVTLALRGIIAREKPHIVHAHNWLLDSFLPLKAWSGAKFVVSMHEYSLVCAKKSLMYFGTPCSGPGPTKCMRCASDHYGTAKALPTVLGNWAMSAVERALVDLFIPVSNAVAKGNGLVGSKLPYKVIPNFVPDSVGDSSSAATTTPTPSQLPDQPFPLFVGALGRHKGVDVLLEAWSLLSDPDMPPLVMIGAPWADTPKEFPAGVQVYTDWPHDAVMEAWRKSAFGLAPSVWPDPCPTVVMEAMAVGKPVIASRIGGLPDLVNDSETGFLVPPADPAALAAAMKRLLDDPSLREHMGQAGKLKVRQFFASTVVERIESEYRALLAEKRARKISRGRSAVATGGSEQ